MPAANSTAPAAAGKRAKPSKPYPEFPLTAHPAGYWCKKIRGKLHYFGQWDDPDGALNLYLAQKEDLHAGPAGVGRQEDHLCAYHISRFSWIGCFSPDKLPIATPRAGGSDNAKLMRLTLLPPEAA
jgi:hypothetical protein